MTVLTQDHSRSISRHLKLNHGVVWLVMFFVLSQMSLHATAQNDSPPMQTLPNPFGGKLDKRMAIIMVVLIAVFVVVAFLSVSTRQCADRRLRGRMDLAIAIGGGSNRRSRVVRGLDAAVIDTFPTFVYSTVKGLKIGKGSLECAVCLSEFEDDEALRLLTKCSHVFHTDCIDAWLASHSTCPVCRANLAPRPGEIPIPCAVVQVSDPDNDSVQPDQRSDTDETQIHDADNQRRDLESESPEVNLVNPSQRTNQNRPPRSRSTGFRLAGIFPRSHSTGHSLVQPGENFDRFTLRLPDEVRSRLMNSTLNRANSCVAFPRVRSSRRGYRSASGGTGRARNFFYERFDRLDRRGFSFATPFFSRSASVRSPKVESGYVGERSSDLLRPDPQV